MTHQITGERARLTDDPRPAHRASASVGSLIVTYHPRSGSPRLVAHTRWLLPGGSSTAPTIWR